jgi:uncharacterized membrane protein
MEISIANMLRIGVILSAILVSIGGILYLVHGPTNEFRQASGRMPDYTHFTPAASSLRTVSGILAGAARLDSSSIIALGILLLIATPIVRVVMCIAGFARQHDKLYILISSAVFAILIFSLMQRT